MKALIFIIFLFTLSSQSFAQNIENFNCESFFVKEDAQSNISKNQRWTIVARNQKHANLRIQDIDMLEDVRMHIDERYTAKYNFRLRIIKNPNITVVAIPDGEIIIDEDFWLSLGQDEQYFTLAHEIGHIIMQHSCQYYMNIHINYMKNMERSTMNIENYMFLHASIYRRLSEFEEKQEIEADNFAFELLKKMNLKIKHLDMLVKHKDTPKTRKNNIVLQLNSINKI